ncbi:MAG: aldo/keto reductase [Thermoleophilia bacterium]|nr:aldo/keto reductase [Thermoleophilia bacterium]
MEQRRAGDSDLRVSVVGLGCNNFGRRLDLEGTRAVVEAAIDAGINHFDTAEAYGDGESERFLGEILRGRRERVVIATKFGRGPGAVDGVTPRGGREYLRKALEGSLARLQTDYVDLYYYHAPDRVTPVAETLAALDEAVREGKVRYAAASNFDAGQLRKAEEAARAHGTTRFVALQNQYSLLERDADDEVLPLCRELEVGFVPYFPLCSGLLTGKYRRGEPPPPGTRLSARADLLDDERFDAVEQLAAFAEERGRTLHELAIGALASTPGVASVIVGATKPEQVRANVTSGAWRLTAEELAAVPRFERRGVHAPGR